MAFGGFGSAESARGVLVQAVNDARPQVVCNCKVFAVVEKRVDEGAAWMTRGGVRHHAGRLVNDDEVVIFIQYFQGDVFCLERKLWGELEAYFNFIADFNGFSLLHSRSVDEDKSRAN